MKNWLHKNLNKINIKVDGVIKVGAVTHNQLNGEGVICIRKYKKWIASMTEGILVLKIWIVWLSLVTNHLDKYMTHLEAVTNQS